MRKTWAEDLTGRRFGRFTVGTYAGKNKHGQNLWLCKCDCGEERTVLGSDLKRGHTKSCGCLKDEISGARFLKHGKRKTRLYHTWLNMKDRCNNPHNRCYEIYGGKGVSVCPEWAANFQTFYDWAMANGYTYKLTIDRIDSNGDYCPSNCRWATAKEQANNTSKNVFVEYHGKRKTVQQWAEETGLVQSTLWRRLFEYGWSVEKALTTPGRKVKSNGE